MLLCESVEEEESKNEKREEKEKQHTQTATTLELKVNFASSLFLLLCSRWEQPLMCMCASMGHFLF